MRLKVSVSVSRCSEDGRLSQALGPARERTISELQMCVWLFVSLTVGRAHTRMSSDVRWCGNGRMVLVLSELDASAH